MPAQWPKRFAQGLSDPLQVLEDALQQATQVDHVFISMSVERARREAEASAARWKHGQPLSPFDGVPVAWKDLFDVAGCVTTAGATVRNNLSPALLDAPSVGLLARAGMVSLARPTSASLPIPGWD